MKDQKNNQPENNRNQNQRNETNTNQNNQNERRNPETPDSKEPRTGNDQVRDWEKNPETEKNIGFKSERDITAEDKGRDQKNEDTVRNPTNADNKITNTGGKERETEREREGNEKYRIDDPEKTKVPNPNPVIMDKENKTTTQNPQNQQNQQVNRGPESEKDKR